MEPEIFVVHYGEIGLKGKNRAGFEQQLVRNIKDSLNGLGYGSVRRVSGRILVYLKAGSDCRKITGRLKRVFGIANFYPGWVCSSGMPDIRRRALEIMKGCKGPIRVYARRGWKGFPKKSMEVNRDVGAVLVKKYGFKVDLGRPKTTLGVEILENITVLYLKVFSGPGGLPVGSSGKAVSLLSGGIDSPVAGWVGMKRGCRVVFVHFYNEVFGGFEKIKKLVGILEEWQPNSKLYVVPFKSTQNTVIGRVPADYRMILYRRLMFMIAQRIAEKEGAKALLTGESLGQVASQTLENMGVIEEAVELPVFRPLLGYDKEEIVNLARKVGTYRTSIKPYQDCCSYMIARHPVTRARVEDVKKLGKRVNASRLVREALKGAVVVKL